MYREFNVLFKDCYNKYSEVRLMRDKLEEMDKIYNNLNDYDLLKENVIRNHTQIFQNHNKQIETTL